MAVKKIPETSVLNYISGRHSLNLDLNDGTGYDWHFMNYWLDGNDPIPLYGESAKFNTNPLFGYYGIADRYRLLRDLGVEVNRVYVANHHRAIIDLVYESLMRYHQIGYAKGCVEDYFFEDHDKKELFDKLIELGDYIDDDRRDILYDWLSREFRPFYKSWKSRTI